MSRPGSNGPAPDSRPTPPPNPPAPAGTTCGCARQLRAGKYDQSAEDRFEQFVQAEIARSPDALRELGEYLGRVLDADEFPQANSLLLQLATEYAAPPAQGIDLAQPAPSVTRYRIEDAPGLDPVTVYVENYEPGKGRMVVTCYASAWTAFWGAMGDDTTLEQFVASCSPEYVADNMVWGADTKKSTKGYADKVAAAVVALFKSQRDAAPGVDRG